MSDDKVEYVSLNEPIENGVLTTQNNQPKLLQSPSKESIKRILRCRIEKENNYVISKNFQFGKWELIKDTSLPAPIPISTSIPNLSQKAAMPDTKSGKPKETVERKKHLQVVNILKESIGAMIMTKRILNLEVNLTVSELLALVLAIEKQLT